MGLNMVQRHAFVIKESFQCTYLIDSVGCELFGLELNFATAKTLNIREAWMSTNFDVVLFALSDSVHHDQRIARMEATCNVGMVDEWNDLVIRAADEVAILDQG